jgi:hypothetical protein
LTVGCADAGCPTWGYVSRLVECEGGFKEARKEPFQFRPGIPGFDISGKSFYHQDS